MRLEHWDSARPLDQQSETFNRHHQDVQATLHEMQQEATRLSADDDDTLDEATLALPYSARKQQRKVCKSLLTHWSGLTLFVDNPQVPLDNNVAENTIRGPVTGRKNYYGSGSLWSATLAAAAFFSPQDPGLMGHQHPPLAERLSHHLCRKRPASPPADISPWLTWSMDQARRDELARPPPTHLAPAVQDSS